MAVVSAIRRLIEKRGYMGVNGQVGKTSWIEWKGIKSFTLLAKPVATYAAISCVYFQLPIPCL